MAESDRERPFAALPKPESGDDPDERRRERRGLFELPQGAFGFFLLLVLAAGCGALIVLYWPWLVGGGNIATDNERIASLETRIDQMAAGQAPSAAAGAFADVRRDLAGLTTRLDADEARLTTVEKSNGQLGDVDVSALKSSLDAASANLAALAARVAKLEQSPGVSAQLTARLDAGDKTLAAMRKDLDDSSKATNDALGSLGTRVDALEKTAPPADLATRLDSFALKADADALAARIARLESNDPVGMIHRAAAVLALADLVRATAGAAPFASELSTLKSFVPDAPEVSDLSRYASAGVPTHAMLAEQFPAVAANALSSERDAKASNWLSRLWANIAGAVSIRRIGEVSGNDTEARLARAGARLDAGDLSGSLAEMQALDAPARAAASGWMAEARARLSVDHDAQALANRLVKNLPPAPPGQAG